MTFPLEIIAVQKSFQQHHVLKDVSLTVEPGEIFGLIGLNGVGKTTLIKIILDLLKADKGRVCFFGQDATIPASRKQICYLPEKFTPSPFLHGNEFLSLALSYYGKKFIGEDAAAQAEALGLDPAALKKKIGKYSKGMGQKLGLMSMFLSGSPLLLLDEPMSGLDPLARIQLKEALSAYSRAGKTVFFTSHILADIHEICSRIAVLDKGEIIFVGTPQEFIGSYSGESLERAFIEAISPKMAG